MKKRTLIKRFGAALLALVMCAGLTAFAAEEFTDVKESDYFYPAVQWGVENEITYGMGDGRFMPNGKVTRAQVVTFLWRMAGTPDPTNKETFSDVASGSWYETAVQWAVENEITVGTGNGQFSPSLTCDRAMCLTFLYRMIGAPLDEIAAMDPVDLEALGEDATLEDLGVALMQEMIAAFRSPEITTDVPQDSYYELAVIWGSMSGVLTEDNTTIQEGSLQFRPTDPCIRAEMISFLYQTKLMQDEANAPELMEFGPLAVAIPQEYMELVSLDVNALGDDEDGIIITVSEKASREAAEALGEDPEETGAGELFSIGRVSKEEAQKIVDEDLGNAEVFAKDENDKYYVFYHPTDVRYVRETPEQMTADQDQWTALNEWAQNDVRKDILQYSEGLTPVTLNKTSSAT